MINIYSILWNQWTKIVVWANELQVLKECRSPLCSQERWHHPTSLHGNPLPKAPLRVGNYSTLFHYSTWHMPHGISPPHSAPRISNFYSLLWDSSTSLPISSDTRAVYNISTPLTEKISMVQRWLWFNYVWQYARHYSRCFPFLQLCVILEMAWIHSDKCLRFLTCTTHTTAV